MTPEQEARGAELFAAGHSERQVAAELGVGTGSAHRLRMRLAKAEAAAEASEPEDPGTAPCGQLSQNQGQNETVIHRPGGPTAAELAAELAGLETQRDGLAETAQTHEERAAVSRSAVMDLEAERLAALEAGRDAAPLRPRIASARADMDDSATAAQMVRDRMAAIDERIAEIRGRQELARLRTELAAAVEDRDAVCSRSGDRQRAAVLAVRAAAEEFTATYTEEETAGLRVEQLAQAVSAWAAGFGEPLPDVPPAASTALAVPGDAMGGAALALVRATYRAREGSAAAVAVQLAEAFGYLPPSPEEIAAERERMARLYAAQPPQPAPQQGQPWTRPDVSSVDVDQYGREISPYLRWPPRDPRLDAWPGVFPYSR